MKTSFLIPISLAAFLSCGTSHLYAAELRAASRGTSMITHTRGDDVEIYRPGTGETAPVSVNGTHGNRPAGVAPGDHITAGPHSHAEVVIVGPTGQVGVIRVRPGTTMVVPEPAKPEASKGTLRDLAEEAFDRIKNGGQSTSFDRESHGNMAIAGTRDGESDTKAVNTPGSQKQRPPSKYGPPGVQGQHFGTQTAR